MNKRALMLTAATAALLSGHAYGASTCDSTSTTGNCVISTTDNAPLYTGAVNSQVSNGVGGLGNITITANGAVTISASPPTAPAITINSGTSGTPAIVTSEATISYTGVSNAVGVLLEEASPPTSATTYGTAENWVGEFVNGTGSTSSGTASDGKIDLTGAGSNKVAILIAGGAYYNSTTGGVAPYTNASTGLYGEQNLGVFTGAPQASGDPIAINLEASSTVQVEGTSSYGIELIGPYFSTAGAQPIGGATLIGDIDVAGSLTMTTVSGATSSGNDAILIAGWMPATNPTSGTNGTTNPGLASTATPGAYAMVGDLNIASTGVVSSQGPGAQGVVVLGEMDGNIDNGGTLETLGTSTPSTATNASNPEGGAALAIANSITGGIFNAGPAGSTGTVTAATISMRGGFSPSGTAEPYGAVEISPQINSNFQYPITIGGYTDSIGDDFSLLNRGLISAQPENSNVSTIAIDISGQVDTPVTLSNGIFNSGKITATGTTNVDESTAPSITAIYIGNNVTISPGSSTLGTAALVNSNESAEGGTISASLSGDRPGSAYGIFIAPASVGVSGGVLSSIINSGTISATATTTDLQISSLSATAIYDGSGSLTSIVNNGAITATVTGLANDKQSATAINVSSNTTAPVSITDAATANGSASISGDIYFGTLPGTLTVTGNSPTDVATVTGDIFFDNSCVSASSSTACSTLTNFDDTLTIGANATVTGEVQEVKTAVGVVDINIDSGGTLNLLTVPAPDVNSTIAVTASQGNPLNAGNLVIQSGGTLDISLSQGYNVAVYPDSSVINVKSANIGDPSNTVQPLAVTFGSYIATPGGNPAEFVLINSTGTITISQTELTSLANEYDGSSNPANGIPFLFTSSICTYNVSGSTIPCPGNEPINSTDEQIVLTLSPKTAKDIGLTGNAAKLFPYVNDALLNDSALGAAMINGIKTKQEAAAAYSSYAPDVSGANRATAISLTDSSTDIVAARQRELRMYAGQEGDTTLWGQQFAQRLSGNNNNGLSGYNDSGFGMVVGMDEGDPRDGRYGAALTFYSGGMSEKDPVNAKTHGEYYLLTGYSDWRGKGLFLDTQLSVGYGELHGHRYIDIDNLHRVANSTRPTELLAGGVTTGAIFTSGGTVLTPQLSLDGMTLREEQYTEGGGGEGFNLHVQPYYTNSLRAFLGADIRQDINVGDMYLQPELRAGYRYDFVDGAVKLKANFASVGPVNAENTSIFSLNGPDPGHGNIVLGGGIATTTGAWSLGLSYDYVKGGNGPTEQSGVFTLVGRI